MRKKTTRNVYDIARLHHDKKSCGIIFEGERIVILVPIIHQRTPINPTNLSTPHLSIINSDRMILIGLIFLILHLCYRGYR